MAGVYHSIEEIKEALLADEEFREAIRALVGGHVHTQGENFDFETGLTSAAHSVEWEDNRG